MLYEVKNVRQHKNEGFRRWFTDKDFDLIIWYDNNKKINGFQLCYNKSKYERALTWTNSDNKFYHNKIDDGEVPGAVKESPILVADGLFDKINVANDFKESSIQIDPQVSNFVYKKILEY
jgi:hypothetical protein